MQEGALEAHSSSVFTLLKKQAAPAVKVPAAGCFTPVREWPQWRLGSSAFPRRAFRSLQLYLISSFQKKQQKSNVITLFRALAQLRHWLSKGRPASWLTSSSLHWVTVHPCCWDYLRVWLHSWALGVLPNFSELQGVHSETWELVVSSETPWTGEI